MLDTNAGQNIRFVTLPRKGQTPLGSGSSEKAVLLIVYKANGGVCQEAALTSLQLRHGTDRRNGLTFRFLDLKAKALAYIRR